MWPGGYLPPVKCHRRVDVLQQGKGSVTHIMHLLHFDTRHLNKTESSANCVKGGITQESVPAASLLHNVLYVSAWQSPCSEKESGKTRCRAYSKHGVASHSINQSVSQSGCK